MRIIGGRLKGKSINPPAGYKARPTTDFAREGLFNILNNEYEFEDLKVLDLFGGTGAVAFEFASRGASRVYSVEMARENASFIKTEAKRLGLDNVTMVRDNVFDFLDICHEKSTSYSLILLMLLKVLRPCLTRFSLGTSFIPDAISSSSMATSILSQTTRDSKKRSATVGCTSLSSNRFPPGRHSGFLFDEIPED